MVKEKYRVSYKKDILKKGKVSKVGRKKGCGWSYWKGASKSRNGRSYYRDSFHLYRILHYESILYVIINHAIWWVRISLWKVFISPYLYTFLKLSLTEIYVVLFKKER